VEVYKYSAATGRDGEKHDGQDQDYDEQWRALESDMRTQARITPATATAAIAAGYAILARLRRPPINMTTANPIATSPASSQVQAEAAVRNAQPTPEACSRHGDQEERGGKHHHAILTRPVRAGIPGLTPRGYRSADVTGSDRLGEHYFDVRIAENRPQRRFAGAV